MRVITTFYRTWTLRDLCYHEDGFNHNKWNRLNHQTPLVVDTIDEDQPDSLLEMLYTVAPCKIESVLEQIDTWPSSDMYTSDYEIIYDDFTPFTWRDIMIHKPWHSSSSKIRNRGAKMRSVLDLIPSTLTSWNGARPLEHDIVSEESYRSRLFLMLPNDLFVKFHSHSKFVPRQMSNQNMYGVHELVHWSGDEARKVIEKWTANLTRQLDATMKEEEDAHFGVYVALASQFKNLSLSETTCMLAAVGMATIVYVIILTIAHPAFMYKSAIYAYFALSTLIAFMSPYISSMVISLHKILEHQKITQVNVLVTHMGPLVVMMFANVFTFYTFRLVNQFASKKCEIHLGEIYVQVREEASFVNFHYDL